VAGTSAAGPMRTCIGCRQSGPKSDLLRVVAQGSLLVPDPQRRLPGRGAYVHPVSECVAAARPRWARALRVTGPVEQIGALWAPAHSEDATDRESAVRKSTR
jgi:predicted RNA-binding protein YlxR (DUF448 family)